MIFYRPRIFRFGDNDITDHNRSPVAVNFAPIESRIRTAGGGLRILDVAEKHTFSASWERTPRYGIHTVDQHWSGQEILDYYKTHRTTPFVLEVYGNEWDLVNQFTVVFSDFSYDIISRRDIELWNFGLELEEV